MEDDDARRCIAAQANPEVRLAVADLVVTNAVLWKARR